MQSLHQLAGPGDTNRYTPLSTNSLSRAKDVSHCREIRSSDRRASSSRRRSSRQRLSLPRRVERTSPAPASTRRCFVTPWRVIPEPAVSREMDRGSPPAS